MVIRVTLAEEGQPLDHLENQELEDILDHQVGILNLHVYIYVHILTFFKLKNQTSKMQNI